MNNEARALGGPCVSIVIPTYNRWERLLTVLEGIARQDVELSKVEVIVVSDGSTDGTDERLEKGLAPLPVRLIQQQNQGPATARNNGCAHAKADLVLFLDDDVVPAPELIRIHLERHRAADDRTILIGPLLNPDDFTLEPWVLWEQRMLYKQYDAIERGDLLVNARQFYTGNASVPKSLLAEVGGFDSDYRRGEDLELAYRLASMGTKFEFEPLARGFHHASRSYESWLSNAASYGRNDVLLWRDQGQHWLLPTVREEFDRRNRLTRLYTFRTISGGRLPNWLSGHGGKVSRVLHRIGLGAAGQAFLSGIYNANYYQALADELGSFDDFLNLRLDPSVKGPG